MKLLIKIMLFLLISINAFADLTGNVVLNHCHSNNEVVKTLCIAYFLGYQDGLMNGSLIKANDKRLYTMSPQTVINLFEKEIKNNPLSGDLYVAAAITDALIKSGIISYKK